MMRNLVGLTRLIIVVSLLLYSSLLTSTLETPVAGLSSEETRLNRDYKSWEELKSSLHRDFKHYPIRENIVIDGLEWDIVVPDNYSSIQEAINHAEIGYRIYVRTGIYKENIVIDKDGIILHGENKETTIIDGNNKNYTILLESNYNNISGFTIKNGVTGLYLNTSSGNQIQNNIITNNQQGITLYRAHANNIENNQIKNNQNGITIKYSTNVVVSSNIIQNTWSTKAYRGIRIYDSYNVTITDSVVENCSYRGIIEESGSDWNVIIGVRAVDSPVNIDLSGANTQCHLCYNGTSWIP